MVGTPYSPLYRIVKSCALLLAIFCSLGEWHDASCAWTTCAICNMKSTPVFEMRGLCIGTVFDQHYSWTGKLDKQTERYNFQGFTNSEIKWNEDQKEWRLTLHQDNKIYGICNETHGLYPFGTFDWHIFNDSCNEEKRAISFSGWYS